MEADSMAAGTTSMEVNSTFIGVYFTPMEVDESFHGRCCKVP